MELRNENSERIVPALLSDSSGQVQDGWQAAVQAHLASLSPSQRARFVAPTTADDCMNITIKSERSRKATKALEFLQPVLQPLKRFERVIDVLVQTNGGIGSPIWGPIKMAVMISCDHLETIQKLTLVLQRIVTSLERYHNYDILFKSHIETQKAIGTLYVDLLDLCSRVVRFYSRPSITAVFVSFDKEFQQVSENVAYHSTQIDWAANAANIEEAKSARGHEENTRQGQTRLAIHQWLAPSTVQDDLSRHEDEYMINSCDWVYDTLIFQDFISSQSSQILRIGGAPGTGKSTLAAYILRRLTQGSMCHVLYFFCRGTDDTKRHTHQVLRTLISQLLARDQTLYSWFETLHQQSGQKEAKSVADLRRSFALALTNTSLRSIYIIVDALDEAEKPEELIRSLELLMSTTQGSNSNTILKLVVTSRNEPRVTDAFDQQPNELLILPQDIRGPIWTYVQERVSKMKHLQATELGSIVFSKVASSAEGSWLYARLMLDEIQRLPSPGAIERQLQNIPKGLSQLYQQIFATMVENLDPIQRQIAEQIFLWIDLTTFVHVGGIQLEQEVLDIVLEAANSGEAVFDSLDLTRLLCAPLLEVRNEHGRLVVDFVHHTAAQFVEQSFRGQLTEVPLLLRPQKLKELYHGATSVYYFSQCTKSVELWKLQCIEPDITKSKAYFEMAYGLWDAFFMHKLPVPTSPTDFEEAARLCNVMSYFIQSEDCLRWVELAIIINYGGGFTKLFGNAQDSFKAAVRGLKSTFPPFAAYSRVRKQFFADFRAVLVGTGPKIKFDQEPEIDQQGVDRSLGATIWHDFDKMSKGSEDRPMAIKLFALGTKWQHLCLH